MADLIIHLLTSPQTAGLALALAVHKGLYMRIREWYGAALKEQVDLLNGYGRELHALQQRLIELGKNLLRIPISSKKGEQIIIPCGKFLFLRTAMRQRTAAHMLISKRKNFIFIHIYKTGGVSITQALMPFAAPGWLCAFHRFARKAGFHPRIYPHPYDDHATAGELIEAMGADRFDKYFSFAFVRNPWAWHVSFYTYILQSRTHYQHDMVREFGSFENYIKWRCSRRMRPQMGWIYSPAGELLVDFVGRVETIASDFKSICNHLGIAADLHRLNVSGSRPYRDFYNDETRELVQRTFRPDIELFGYEF